MTGSELISVKQRFGIIGNSEALNTALEIALRVAPTDLSVLVTGESGVGKEFFPQVIHSLLGTQAQQIHSSQLRRNTRGNDRLGAFRP